MSWSCQHQGHVEQAVYSTKVDIYVDLYWTFLAVIIENFISCISLYFKNVNFIVCDRIGYNPWDGDIYSSETVHRHAFWRQFTDKIGDSSLTYLKTVHWQNNILEYQKYRKNDRYLNCQTSITEECDHKNSQSWSDRRWSLELLSLIVEKASVFLQFSLNEVEKTWWTVRLWGGTAHIVVRLQ